MQQVRAPPQHSTSLSRTVNTSTTTTLYLSVPYSQPQPPQHSNPSLPLSLPYYSPHTHSIPLPHSLTQPSLCPVLVNTSTTTTLYLSVPHSRPQPQKHSIPLCTPFSRYSPHTHYIPLPYSLTHPSLSRTSQHIHNYNTLPLCPVPQSTQPQHSNPSLPLSLPYYIPQHHFTTSSLTHSALSLSRTVNTSTTTTLYLSIPHSQPQPQQSNPSLPLTLPCTVHNSTLPLP